MIGVCVALDLQSRGARVTLLDRCAPGRETSFGNAGVLARSSLVPFNNPDLFRLLPRLLGRRQAALNYDARYLAGNLRWAISFLANARSVSFAKTATALNDLIELSIPAHKNLIARCGLGDLLSERGWMFLYRSETGFARARLLRQILDQFDVANNVLDQSSLQSIEPSLRPIFHKALWVKDSSSVNNPGELVSGYARQFVADGGTLKMGEVSALHGGDVPGVTLKSGERIKVDHCTLCLGPWSKALLEKAGYRVPMAFERGYHRHFLGSADMETTAQLGRPVYDTSGGYVLSPTQQGLRLTTGVELAALNAPQNHQQLELAEIAARQAIDLGERGDGPTWMGARPTFPDSRPCIGHLPHSPGVSVAFGHHHIGFSTAPGTALLLGDLIEGRKPSIDPAPFRPGRHLSRR